jgi:hypothetical protein
MKTRTLFLLALSLILMLSCVAGCGTYVNDTQNEPCDEEQGKDYKAVSPDTKENLSLPTGKKIIVTVEYSLETKKFNETVNALNAKVAKHGGYAESASVNNDSEECADAYFIFRIPSDKLNAFLTDVENSAKVIRKRQTAEDVTLDYHDTESQLTALRLQEERILALLKDANYLSDILNLENELARIRGMIEKLTSSLNKYDNLIDYATVKVSLKKVVEFTETEETYIQVVKDAFGSTMYFSKSVLHTLSYAIVWLSPYLILAGIVAAVILLILKIKKRKTKS